MIGHVIFKLRYNQIYQLKTIVWLVLDKLKVPKNVVVFLENLNWTYSLGDSELIIQFLIFIPFNFNPKGWYTNENG